MVIASIVLSAALTLTNVTQIAQAFRARRADVPFDVTARLTHKIDIGDDCSVIAIEDETGAAVISDPPAHLPPLSPGDMLRLKGRVSIDPRRNVPFTRATSIERVGSGPAPVPRPATADDINANRCDNRLVELRGTVRDVFQDEIDAHITFFLLDCQGKNVYLSLYTPTNAASAFQQLIAADVSAVGVCKHDYGSLRSRIGHVISLKSPDAIRIVRPAGDLYQVGTVEEIGELPPDLVANLGWRRTGGRVAARWHRNRMLVMTPDRQLVGCECADFGEGRPNVGEAVDVVGIVESDLYRYNLSRARWRKSRDPKVLAFALPKLEPMNIRATQVLGHNQNFFAADDDFHGRTVRLEGIVRNTSVAPGGETLVVLDNDGMLVHVETSAPAPAVGSRVSVRGICIVNVENWRAHQPFPHTTGFLIVTQDASGLAVVARPPWWTTGRLFAVLCALVCVLIGFSVWNRLLNRLAERRGRQLFEEEIARTSAELRIDERTRLATELHDSLSQNLAAIACQAAAIRKSMETDSSYAKRCLLTVEQMLSSCRSELKYNLFDLRSDMLEEPDFAEAIRKSLQRFCGAAKVVLRFNVPRAQLLDSTAHAILRVIRELASNAVRHGHAKTVRIAGGLDRGILRFSVRDDGDGFDPEACPGPQEGHFGLDGIRNRLNRFGGTLDITSQPGLTRVTVSIPLSGRQEP